MKSHDGSQVSFKGFETSLFIHWSLAIGLEMCGISKHAHWTYIFERSMISYHFLKENKNCRKSEVILLSLFENLTSSPFTLLP